MTPTIATCLALALVADAPAPDPRAAQAQTMAEIRSDRDLLEQYQRHETTGQIGLGVMGIGAATLLFVTIPSWRLYERALDDAADERTIVTQDTPLRRARTRRGWMLASLGVGSGLVALGATIAITGYARRNRMRNAPPRTLSFAPAFDDTGVGAVATLRF